MRTLIFFLAILICNAACKKSTTPAAPVGLPKGVFAKINGISTAFDSVVLVTKSISGGKESIDFEAGRFNNYLSLAIQKTGKITTGTYNFVNPEEAIIIYKKNEYVYSNVFGGSGSILVTAVDTSHVEGAFSASAVSLNDIMNPVSVTEGTFNVEFK